MQKEILNEIKKLKDTAEFVIENEDEIESVQLESYLRDIEKIRYNIFSKIKICNKYIASENEKINYLNEAYKAEVDNDILKIYIPEVIPKYKNINNFAYKNIMYNVKDQTDKYKDLFKDELVFVFIKVVENQKNIDIDNKFIKPIVDGLVLSKVIKDDNIANMFYGVIGMTDETRKPYTEVFVFKGTKFLKWIESTTQTDIFKMSD